MRRRAEEEVGEEETFCDSKSLKQFIFKFWEFKVDVDDDGSSTLAFKVEDFSPALIIGKEQETVTRFMHNSTSSHQGLPLHCEHGSSMGMQAPQCMLCSINKNVVKLLSDQHQRFDIQPALKLSVSTKNQFRVFTKVI